MGVEIRAVRQAAITAGSTQDFTVSGLGSSSDIKGAKFIVTRATADGTSADHNVFSVGFTDGTNQRCFSVVDEDGQTTMDSSHRATTDEVIQILDLDGSIDGEANFDSFITDGVRINWGNLPASGYLVTCILYAGSDLTIDVGTITTSSSIGGTASVTGMSDEPEAIEFYTNFSAIDDTARDAAELSIGFAANAASIEQACSQFVSDSGVTTSSLGQRQEVTRIATRTDTAFANLGGAELTSFNSDGFTLTTRDAANSHDIAYFSLCFNGSAQARAGSYSVPGATGSTAVTGIGFRPGFLQYVLSQTTVNNGAVNNNRAGSNGIGFATHSEEFSNNVTSQDGQSTSQTTSWADDMIVHARTAPGTADGTVGTLVSFDSDGYTINWTTVFGVSRTMPFLAIQRVFSGTGDITLPSVEASGSGTHTQNFTGTGAITLPSVEASGAGTLAFTGTGAVTLPSINSQGVGVQGAVTGSGAITLPAITAAGSGQIVLTGSGAITLGAIQASGTGVQGGVAGTGDVSLPSITVDGSGAITFTGSGAITLPAVEAAGSGTVGSVTGSGAVTLPAVDAAGSGILTFTGSGAITLPAIETAGTGAFGSEPIGSGAPELGSIEISGSGTHTPVFTGSGAITLGSVSASGAARMGDVSGTGAVTLAAIESAGAGLEVFSGTGAITLPAVDIDGSGNAGAGNTTGSGAITLPAVDAAGVGVLKFVGSGTITLPSIEVSGSDAPPVESCVCMTAQWVDCIAMTGDTEIC